MEEKEEKKFTFFLYYLSFFKFLVFFQTLRYLWMSSSLLIYIFYLEILPLSENDKILVFGDYGNFSLSGFEMILTRYVSTYIITYYLPSGKFISFMEIAFPIGFILRVYILKKMGYVFYHITKKYIL